MVFGGGPLNTLKLFWPNVLLFFIKMDEKCIFYHFKKKKMKILLVSSKQVILTCKTFKYVRYKKVFLDENPKTRF